MKTLVTKEVNLKVGDKFSITCDKPTYEVIEIDQQTATIKRLANNVIDYNQKLTNSLVHIFNL